MTDDDPQGVRRALLLMRTSIRAVVITALLLLVPSMPSQQAGFSDSDAVERAMSQHDCRPTGFSAHPDAAAALVRRPDGEIEVVGRRAGRQVYAGNRPGTLLGVCGV